MARRIRSSTGKAAGAHPRADKRLDEIAGFYATLMAAAAKSDDPRLRSVFVDVRREAFFPPGPWQIRLDDHYYATPSGDPIYLYQNELVALDAAKGINNGEPFLHAAWIGAVAPRAGEVVVHVGAGMGYYTAILSQLVLPGGSVTAFEIEPRLAAAARINLRSYANVSATTGDAVRATLPDADIIYVNAGVAVPPLAWLDALKPGGRLILPWRPTIDVALAVIIRRVAAGFAFEPLMSAWFIPCIGASESPADGKPPSYRGAWRTRAVHRTADRAPDETATAVYADLWFSSEALTA